MLTRRVQSGSQTVAQFVTELREKAAKCGFVLRNLMSGFVTRWWHGYSSLKCARGYRKSLTILRMVQLATTFERSAQESPALGESKQAVVGRVGLTGVRRRSQRATNTSVTCFKCGREGHRPKSPQCPALGKPCKKCNKLNRFAKIYKSRKEYGKDKPADKSRSTDAKTVGMVSVSGELKTVGCLLNGTQLS